MHYCIVFVRFYFGAEKRLRRAQADQDYRPSQQGFRAKWKEKIEWRNA